MMSYVDLMWIFCFSFTFSPLVVFLYGDFNSVNKKVTCLKWLTNVVRELQGIVYY